MKMIEQILDFTGLEMTIEIKSWLKENTASSDGGTYSVHRNATESGETLTQLDLSSFESYFSDKMEKRINTRRN